MFRRFFLATIVLAGCGPSPPAAVIPHEVDVAAGQRDYALYCASCHGESGDATGPLASSLAVQPADHTDGAYMNRLSDAYLYQVIDEGGPAVGKSHIMAAWGGTMADEQIWNLVVFIRSLAEPPYSGVD